MPDTRTQAQGPPEDWKLVLHELVKHTTKPHVPHPKEEKVESFNGSKNDRERDVDNLRKFEFTCQLNGYNDDETKIEKLGAALSVNAFGWFESRYTAPGAITRTNWPAVKEAFCEVALYINAIMHPQTSRGYYLTLGFGLAVEPCSAQVVELHSSK